ncbi:MAG: hypothetical protein Q9162_006807 [Coniocarpon cinnabarinum]
MRASVFAAGNTALITGGASGVGLAVAQLCRKHGMKLAIVDNNAETLGMAKQTLGTEQPTETYQVDVSDQSQWPPLKEKVQKTLGGVDLLMLNAGMQIKGGWENSAYFEKILGTNLFGVIYGINTFLPLIQSQQSQKPSAIVITGSKQGITNPPGNPAYNSSKAAVKSIAEQLSYEMRGSNTGVHLCVPGWTYTGLSGGGPQPSSQKKDGQWYPEQVADYLKEKMDAGKFWAICPDNDVTENKDRRRMLWTAGDAVYNRLPLSRWREEYKDEAEKDMAAMKSFAEDLYGKMDTDISLPELLNRLRSSTELASSALPPEESIHEPDNGISLLNTKNELFLSYLQSLVFLIILKLNRYSSRDNASSGPSPGLDDATVKQLAELKLYLEKGARPIESRLQYEIDKVTRVADATKSGAKASGKKDRSGSGTRAQKKSHQRRASDASASSVSSEGSSHASGSEKASDASDSDETDEQVTRPNLAGMAEQMRKSTHEDRSKQAGKKPGVYRPPRVNPTSLPTTDTINDSARSERRSRPVRSAAVDDYISTELGDNPAAEPSIGSTIIAGGRRNVSDRERRKEDEIRRYEESNFIRLPGESKKDRQKRKRTARGPGGFGANEFGLNSLSEMGDRVGRAMSGAKKRRR